MTEEYRGYRITDDGFSMFKIIQMGKGAVPKSLNSKYTSRYFAKVAIDGYLAIKGDGDGKTDSSSGD